MSTQDGPQFSELGLSEETLRGVTAAGYEDPTPIQALAIPVLLQGRDLIGQAQTGTGKTAAFGLPLIDRLDPTQMVPQALIVCPTRELAVQVSEAIYTFGRPKGFRVLPVYGGQPIDRQLRALRGGVQIVVGTPGRLLDHLRRGTLDLTHVKTVILDEADEMLDMGFIEDIEVILSALPEERQIGLFSATMPAPIVRLAQRHLRSPERISIAAEPQNVPQIRQCYYEVHPAHKMDALCRILDMETPGPTIIFCRTKREADEVGEHLRGRGYFAESLHGDLGQNERDRAMRRFRSGQTDLLVATDVAARGLDIEGVTHVINYDIPWSVEAYTHRIGRTGRAGREGDAITLVSPRERRQLGFIERATGSRIQPVRIPSLADIAARRREMFKQTIIDALEVGDSDAFLHTVEELCENWEASDIAAAAIKLLWQQQKHQLAAQEMQPNDGARVEAGMARLFITLGREQGLRPSDLVGAIANEAGVAGHHIGAIDILDFCSFVEVPEEAADRVVKALMKTKLRGRRVKVEKAPPGSDGLLMNAPQVEGDFERPRPASRRPEDRPFEPGPGPRDDRPARPPRGPAERFSKDPRPKPDRAKPANRPDQLDRTDHTDRTERADRSELTPPATGPIHEAEVPARQADEPRKPRRQERPSGPPTADGFRPGGGKRSDSGPPASKKPAKAKTGYPRNSPPPSGRTRKPKPPKKGG